MKERVPKFLNILKIELDDLVEDINTLSMLTEERRKNRDITEYVSMENMNLLKQEFSGIRQIVDELDRVELIEQENFKDFIDRLKLRIRQRLKRSAYPDAVYIFVERKVDKVAEYIQKNTI